MSIFEHGFIKLLSVGTPTPRPVLALARIVTWSTLFVFSIGIIYFYSFIASLPSENRDHLMRFFWIPVDHLYYGALATIGLNHNNGLSLLTWLAVCSFVWFWAVKLLAIGSTSFAKEARERYEAEIAGDKKNQQQGEKRENSNTSYSASDWGCIFWGSIFVVALLLRVGDLLLCACILGLLALLALLLVNGEFNTGGELLQWIGDLSTRLELPGMNVGDIYFALASSLNVGSGPRFHFTAVTALLLAWISFRQSGTFLAVRAALLVTSTVVMVLLASFYGVEHGQETITFWQVQVRCDRPSWDSSRTYILLDRSGEGATLYDLEANRTYEIVTGISEINYVARSTLGKLLPNSVATTTITLGGLNPLDAPESGSGAE